MGSEWPSFILDSKNNTQIRARRMAEETAMFLAFDVFIGSFFCAQCTGAVGEIVQPVFLNFRRNDVKFLVCFVE